MSIFRTEGIVLQVGKYSEKELFYKIFFRDYGILTVTKKKKVREKPIDIGYFISCEIITHSEKKVHTIGNIRVQCFFISQKKSYKDIENFLTLISYIKTELPEGNPHYEIYDILTKYIEHCEHSSLLLTHLKISQCFGTLPESHSDKNVQKVLKFIHSHHYKDIIRLKNIPEDLQKKLEQML